MSDSQWDAHGGLRPIAVMVDNAPAAYPHYGLQGADLVYEAFVEGNITRFMAVYWRGEADRIEPVRSARTPFVVWASELGAIYAHAGSAETDNEADAGGQILEWAIPDMSAFLPGPSVAFYRDELRYAPHNLVTATDAMRAAAAALDFEGPPTAASWPYKADSEGTSPFERAAGVEVNFRDERIAGQAVQWHWEPSSNTYLRFQWGGPHLDADTKQQLRFKNVIVMRVPWEVIDFSGHVLLDQFGEGPATVFLDGRAIDCTWRKPDREARTRFYDALGREIAFNRGATFIEVVGPESLVIRAVAVVDLPEILPYTPPGADFVPGEPGPDETPTPDTSTQTAATATPTEAATRTPTPGATPSPGPSATPE